MDPPAISIQSIFFRDKFFFFLRYQFCGQACVFGRWTPPGLTGVVSFLGGIWCIGCKNGEMISCKDPEVI